jgi:hypothetical protein
MVERDQGQEALREMFLHADNHLGCAMHSPTDLKELLLSHASVLSGSGRLHLSDARLRMVGINLNANRIKSNL